MILALLRFLTFILATLPEAANRVLAAALGDFVFFFLPSRRRIILSNLSHAFPAKPHAWLVRMGRTSCRRMIEVGMIAIASPRLSEARLKKMAQTDAATQSIVDHVLDEPRPMVAAFPHLGAWELAGAFISFLDRPLREMGCMYRPLDNPKLNEWLESSRSRFGIRMLSRKHGFSEGMSILRKGGFFVLLFDQNAGKNGTLSLFFDRVCSSTNLPGLMMEKFSAGLVAFYVKRTGFWRYTIAVHQANDAPADPDIVSGYLDAWLTKILRSDEDLCASWLWAHNRWKVHRDPRKRFSLDHKRSSLPKGGIPRNERFFVRMPDDLTRTATALPLVRALRASRPDAAITALAAPTHVPILQHSGLCEHVLALPAVAETRRAFLRSLRRSYPDIWIDLSGVVDAGTEGRLVDCPQRFGINPPDFTRKNFNHLWTPPANLSESDTAPIHVWEEFLRHFGLQGGLDLSPIAFRDLPQPLEKADPNVCWIGLHVGSQTTDHGRWPALQWRELIEHLLETDSKWRLALLGEDDDRIIANTIGAHYPHDRVVNLVEKLSVLETAGAINQCRIVVTANPAAMTLANGQGIATVALFGPLNPAAHTPPFFAPLWTLQPPGCPETGGGALSGLSPESVAEAAIRALQA